MAKAGSKAGTKTKAGTKSGGKVRPVPPKQMGRKTNKYASAPSTHVVLDNGVPLPDWSDTPLRTSDFRSLVEKYGSLQAQKKLLEAQQEELKLEILALMEAEEVEAVGVWPYRAKHWGGRNSRVDPKLLLKYGVDGRVVAKATVTSEFTVLSIVDVEQVAKDRLASRNDEDYE